MTTSMPIVRLRVIPAVPIPSALSIGTVMTGDTAAAEITGDPPNQVLDLTLPPGSVDTVNGYAGPTVVLAKSDIGLGAVDNVEQVAKAGDTMNGALGVVVGAANTPGMYIVGDTNTGIFGTGSDVLAFATAGTERGRFDANGMLSLTGGSFSRGAPVTKTADFAPAATENNLISNKSSSCTVTLPAAATFPGREILIKTITAQTVVSASSNVCPTTSATPGTAILAGTAGKWALLVSDGTNWIVMAAN